MSSHHRWVRISHWVITLAFLVLVYSGIVILMAHPRLYWGDVGNDLTPALMELPISRNYKHNGWGEKQAFFTTPNSPVSAPRTYDIFNENGWGRSLHFLAAWFLVITGLLYLITGALTGHFKKNMWPKSAERSRTQFVRDLKDHIRFHIPRATGGPSYGLLQKITYIGVVFITLPLMVATGFAMSPALTNAYPFILDAFGGYQSARTIHFFAFIALLIFLAIHLTMIVLSGFKTQVRGMTIGSYEKTSTHSS